MQKFLDKGLRKTEIIMMRKNFLPFLGPIALLTIVLSGLSSCNLMRPVDISSAFVHRITLIDPSSVQALILQNGEPLATGIPEGFNLATIQLETSTEEVQNFLLEIHYPEEGQIILSSHFSSDSYLHTLPLPTPVTLSQTRLFQIRIKNESDWLGSEWFRGTW